MAEENLIGSNKGQEGGVVVAVSQGDTTQMQLKECFLDGIKPDLCDFNLRPVGIEIGDIPNFSSGPVKKEAAGNGRCCSRIICNGKLIRGPVACGARTRSDF